MRQTVIKMHQPAMQITKDYEFILDFGLCPVKKLCKTCPAQCHEHVWQTWNSVVSSHFRTVIKWTKISFPLWHRASRAAQTRANRMLPSQEGAAKQVRNAKWKRMALDWNLVPYQYWTEEWPFIAMKSGPPSLKFFKMTLKCFGSAQTDANSKTKQFLHVYEPCNPPDISWLHSSLEHSAAIKRGWASKWLRSKPPEVSQISSISAKGCKKNVWNPLITLWYGSTWLDQVVSNYIRLPNSLYSERSFANVFVSPFPVTPLQLLEHHSDPCDGRRATAIVSMFFLKT